ncbi:unnamed protein product, partial [Amoebophrya sp. A120]
GTSVPVATSTRLLSAASALANDKTSLVEINPENQTLSFLTDRVPNLFQNHEWHLRQPDGYLVNEEGSHLVFRSTPPREIPVLETFGGAPSMPQHGLENLEVFQPVTANPEGDQVSPFKMLPEDLQKFYAEYYHDDYYITGKAPDASTVRGLQEG